jgi:hypothetical protein
MDDRLGVVVEELAALRGEVTRMAGIIDGWVETAAAESAPAAEPVNVDTLEAEIRGQNWYTLVGVWPETKERWGDQIQAEGPRQAEDLAQMAARNDPDSPGVLWVCGIMEGIHYAVDKYATFADDPDRTKALEERND